MDNQQYDDILKEEKLQEIRVGLKVIIFVLAILVCLQKIEIFNVARMAKGISAMGTFFLNWFHQTSVIPVVGLFLYLILWS